LTEVSILEGQAVNLPSFFRPKAFIASWSLVLPGAVNSSERTDSMPLSSVSREML